ncbi:hypothetical protein [uncultured Salinicola sp.]|uniref:hypothetical protein n=1 Tax=uncultured Salinicola sp. TaxID=1193542 RepID=UPI002624F7F2|nr:hypothetical protein [uncultured Salinicola sp.]
MPRANGMEVVEADEEVVRRTATIMGPSSASARAIKDLEARRAAGEEPVIYQRGSILLVGPRAGEETEFSEQTR